MKCRTWQTRDWLRDARTYNVRNKFLIEMTVKENEQEVSIVRSVSNCNFNNFTRLWGSQVYTLH